MDPPAPEVDPDELDVDDAPPTPPDPDDASSAPASGVLMGLGVVPSPQAPPRIAIAPRDKAATNPAAVRASSMSGRSHEAFEASIGDLRVLNSKSLFPIRRPNGYAFYAIHAFVRKPIFVLDTPAPMWFYRGHELETLVVLEKPRRSSHAWCVGSWRIELRGFTSCGGE